MTCDLENMLDNIAKSLENQRGESPWGYGFALRELGDNLRELKERTDKGDMAALQEFFAAYVFHPKSN